MADTRHVSVNALVMEALDALEREGNRFSGKVGWVNKDRTLAKIRPDAEGAGEVLLHISDFQSKGEPVKNQPVTFRLARGRDGGRIAKEVRRVEIQPPDVAV